MRLPLKKGIKMSKKRPADQDAALEKAFAEGTLPDEDRRAPEPDTGTTEAFPRVAGTLVIKDGKLVCAVGDGRESADYHADADTEGGACTIENR